jgi:iron complex outermembrane receptor protein
MIFGDYARWGSSNVIRRPADPAYPNLPGPIDSVILWDENLGNLRTSGYDIDIKWRGPATSIGRFTVGLNGTYISTYKLNSWGRLRLRCRKQHVRPGPALAALRVAQLEPRPWSATLGQNFQNGYSECDDVTLCSGDFRRVGSYSVWDLQGQYTGFKNAAITLASRTCSAAIRRSPSMHRRELPLGRMVRTPIRAAARTTRC